MHWAFAHLGLPADADERAVKRAYAQRLKTTRPDEDPQGFQRLREAYEAALARARSADRRPAWQPDVSTGAGPAAGPASGQGTAVDPPPAGAGLGLRLDAQTENDAPASPPILLDPASDAIPPPTPFPPPSNPAPDVHAPNVHAPNVRIHIAQDWTGTYGGGPQAPRPEPPSASPAAASFTPAPPLTPRRFAKALAEQAAASTPEELGRWLAAHEGLYDLANKTALVVPLIRELDHRLGNGKGELGKAHLDVVLAFFGLDQVNQTRESLKPELERLEGAAGRQRRGQDIDWNRVLSESGHAPPRRHRPPPFWHGIPPSVSTLIVIVLLSLLRACSEYGA